MRLFVGAGIAASVGNSGHVKRNVTFGCSGDCQICFKRQ